MIFQSTLAQKVLYKFFVSINRQDLAKIPVSILTINFVFQRIFGINRKIPISIHYTSRVQGYHNMTLGETVKYSLAVSASANIVVSDGTTLTIGEDTIFAQNVCIRTSNHDLIDRSKYIKDSVSIGDNCWLGHGAVMLPGSSIGNNVTVGANSVVTKSFGDNLVIAGIPAKVIKEVKV